MIIKCRDELGNAGVILAFADDILIVTRSVHRLQTCIDVLRDGLAALALSLNTKKSMVCRVGPRYSASCAPITVDGNSISYVDKMRYLGVYLVSGRKFAADYTVAKRKFCCIVNAIVAKIGTSASAPVILHLVSAQGLPALLYGCEALDPPLSVRHSFDFYFYRFLFKLLRTGSRVIVDQVLAACGVQTPSSVISQRLAKFAISLNYNRAIDDMVTLC